MIYSNRFSSIIFSIVVFLSTNVYSAHVQRKSFLLMATRGIQKLGQSVIGTTVPPVTQGPDSTSSVFRRVPVGSGCDDRTVLTPFDDEVKWASLSKIDKFFQQKTLLMGLESSSWGTAEKIERVRNAANFESLLPSSFSNEMIRSPNLKSGGLLKDWDM
mmetsp:Transcript_32441/g.44303  ORF Transcript_32441/g.44303 Transcript_32441/m.44303 type:complete len:159 (+) Transcript_32441:122-598(+)